MKTYLTIIVLLLALTSFGQTAIKKSSIDSGGAISTNGSLSMVYTLGEAAVQESTTAIIHISEGFLGANISTSALGLEDYGQLRGIRIYPNPATDFVNIRFPNTGNYEVEIYNLLNERVGVYRSENGMTQRIELSHLQNAVYLVIIKNTDTKQYKTYKIVKQ